MKNTINIIGRLGNDPELKTLQSGKVVCNLSVATGSKYTNKETGEVVENTEWHRVAIWKPKVAETVSRLLRKGALVHIEGMMTYQKYQTKSGDQATAATIRCDQIHFLSKVEQTQSENQASEAGSYSSPTPF